MQRVEKGLVAELFPKHFQHPAAFAIDIAGKVGRVVEAASARWARQQAPLAEPLTLFAPEGIGRIMSAIMLLLPEVLEASEANP